MSTIPRMQSSDPWATVQRVLIGMQQQLDQIRSSMGMLENATIGKGGLTLKDAGALTMLDEAGRMITQLRSGAASYYDPSSDGRVTIFGGRIYFWDLGGEEGDTSVAGQMMVDQGAGRNVMRLFPPHETGSGLETSFTMRGKTADQTGMVWVYTDGDWIQQADGLASTRAASIILNTTAGELGIYGLPTTSGGYLLRYNQVGGKWTMALDSSSRRYKANIRDADLHPADVLKWRPRRWQDINQGEDAPWNTGLIAEEVHDAGTTEFVIYDEQGRPDGIRKEILAVGQQVVLQDHERRITELEQQDHERSVAELEQQVDQQAQEIAALRDANEALALRLDALEARP